LRQSLHLLIAAMPPKKHNKPKKQTKPKLQVLAEPPPHY
jgi:hypothetical protein